MQITFDGADRTPRVYGHPVSHSDQDAHLRNMGHDPEKVADAGLDFRDVVECALYSEDVDAILMEQVDKAERRTSS